MNCCTEFVLPPPANQDVEARHVSCCNECTRGRLCTFIYRWPALAQTIYCARFGVPSVLLTALHNEKNRQSLDWFVWKPRLTDCPSSKPLTLMELQRSQIETWQVRTDIPAPPPGALGMTDACVANHQQSNRLIFCIDRICDPTECTLTRQAVYCRQLQLWRWVQRCSGLEWLLKVELCGASLASTCVCLTWYI